MHRASPWAQGQSQGSGIPRELRVLPCLPAPVGSRRRWKRSPARSKRSAGFCSHLLLIYAMALCNFPKADGQFSSSRQESGPRRLVYFGALLACENRPKAERRGTPYCKCTHATQTQLMPDVQTLTLLIRSLRYCMADEQIPKDGHLLSPTNKQTTVEKGAINKAVNQLKLNKTFKHLNTKRKSLQCPPNPAQWAKCNSLPTRWRWRPVFAYLRWLTDTQLCCLTLWPVPFSLESTWAWETIMLHCCLNIFLYVSHFRRQVIKKLA